MLNTSVRKEGTRKSPRIFSTEYNGVLETHNCELYKNANVLFNAHRPCSLFYFLLAKDEKEWKKIIGQKISALFSGCNWKWPKENAVTLLH